MSVAGGVAGAAVPVSWPVAVAAQAAVWAVGVVPVLEAAQAVGRVAVAVAMPVAFLSVIPMAQGEVVTRKAEAAPVVGQAGRAVVLG
jgi:hypothetical protein